MPNTCVPAAGEAMPAANLNRRRLLLGLASVTATVGTTMAIGALPVISAAPTVEELLRCIAQLPAMARIFVKQQLYEMHAGEPNIFDGTYSPEEAREIYDDWLTGFDQSVINKFESGEWRSWTC